MKTRAVSIEKQEVEELEICEESYITNERGEVVTKIYKLC